MSRTFRRKNWFMEKNSSWDRKGRKIGGTFTTWDRLTRTGNGHEGVPDYRPMTDSERNAEKLRVHGESKHNNAWGPNRFYRNVAERKSRHETRRELRKALNPEYDAVFHSRYLAHWDAYYW